MAVRRERSSLDVVRSMNPTVQRPAFRKRVSEVISIIKMGHTEEEEGSESEGNAMGMLLDKSDSEESGARGSVGSHGNSNQGNSQSEAVSSSKTLGRDSKGLLSKSSGTQSLSITSIVDSVFRSDSSKNS